MTREEARIKLIEIRAQLEVILSMYGLEISDVFDIAIKALEQEPKIPHWNHGLPDTGDEYIVTVRERWGKDEEWEYETLGAYYTQDGWEPSYDVDEGQEWEIIAWMPLPEPYTEESEGKE